MTLYKINTSYHGPILTAWINDALFPVGKVNALALIIHPAKFDAAWVLIVVVAVNVTIPLKVIDT